MQTLGSSKWQKSRLHNSIVGLLSSGSVFHFAWLHTGRRAEAGGRDIQHGHVFPLLRIDVPTHLSMNHHLDSSIH